MLDNRPFSVKSLLLTTLWAGLAVGLVWLASEFDSFQTALLIASVACIGAMIGRFFGRTLDGALWAIVFVIASSLLLKGLHNL